MQHAEGMATSAPASIPAQLSSEADHYAFGLTAAEVERLRGILRSEYGVELTLEEAWARGIELLAFAKILIESLPQKA